MTSGIREALQAKVDRHVSGEWTVITLNTDDVAELLAENQRMRELLQRGLHDYWVYQKIPYLPIFKEIEAFLAETKG